MGVFLPFFFLLKRTGDTRVLCEVLIWNVQWRGDVSRHSVWSTVMRGSEMSSQHGAKGNLIQGANRCGVKPEPPGRDMTQVPQSPLPQTHSSCIQLWAAFSQRPPDGHDLLVLPLLPAREPEDLR